MSSGTPYQPNKTNTYSPNTIKKQGGGGGMEVSTAASSRSG